VTPEVETLLRLADEKLRAARVLLAADAAGDAASRAYYAAFHAVSAALLSLGQTYSSHGQVLGAFNRHFVHSGRVPRHFTTVLTRLYEDRQTGDYEIATSLALDDGRQDVDDATTVVTAIRELLTTDPS
jgi:uncharacterized protein (UPF0332 family)